MYNVGFFEVNNLYRNKEYAVEELETNLMSQFIKFYFTSSVLNMFRTLIYPSSGACDYSVESPHWLCVLVSMCVGVSVWLVWSGIRVTGRSTASACNTDTTPFINSHPNPATPKLQHTSKEEHTTNVVIQQNSRRLLMMDVLMSETCRAQKK